MKMKNILQVIAIALFIGISTQQIQAQITVNARASAEVIPALSATENAPLNFGRFSPETTGGEIRLAPDGVRSASGTVSLSGGSYNPAVFIITGQNNAAVTISLPSSAALLTNSVNGKTMEINKWESFPPAGLGTGILNDGLFSLSVGATLKVGRMEDNPVGIYSGTYSITFSYN